MSYGTRPDSPLSGGVGILRGEIEFRNLSRGPEYQRRIVNVLGHWLNSTGYRILPDIH